MGYTVYHNPRCTKSRNALQYLDEKGEKYEVVEYLKEIPSKKELKDILKKLGIQAEDLLRKNEAVFKEQYKGMSLTEDEWITAMIENPKLIERPIVILGNKAVVARPTEKIDEL